MKQVLFLLVFLAAGAVLFFYMKGKDGDVVTGSNQENIFNMPDAPDPNAPLPTITSQNATAGKTVLQSQQPAQKVTRRTVVAEDNQPYGDEVVVAKDLRNTPAAKKHRAKALAEQKRMAKTNPKAGGFFMDDDDLPEEVKAAEREWAENRRTGRKPGPVTFLGRSEVGKPTATTSSSGKTGLQFLGRSPNNWYLLFYYYTTIPNSEEVASTTRPLFVVSFFLTLPWLRVLLIHRARHLRLLEIEVKCSLRVRRVV